LSGLSIFFDEVMLDIRGLWKMGVAMRSKFCADGLFCMPVCLTAIASLGLYDCARSFAATLDQGPRRATVCGFIGSLLFITMVANIALAILNSYHYTLDVAVACVVALLVYGNPALALVAERWAAPAGSPKAALPPWPLAEAMGLIQKDPDDADVQAGADLGEVGIAPCCLPFCALGGSYFLRSQPAKLVTRPDKEAVHERRRQLAQLGQANQEVIRRKASFEDELQKERSLFNDKKSQVQNSFENSLRQRIADEKFRLENTMSDVQLKAEQGLQKLSQAAEARVNPQQGIDPVSLGLDKMEGAAQFDDALSKVEAAQKKLQAVFDEQRVSAK